MIQGEEERFGDSGTKDDLARHPLEQRMDGLQCPQGRSLQTRVQMGPRGDRREVEEGSSRQCARLWKRNSADVGSPAAVGSAPAPPQLTPPASGHEPTFCPTGPNKAQGLSHV